MDKEGQNKPKANKGTEIIKVKVEINDTEKRKTVEKKSMKPKAGPLERSTKWTNL